MPSPFRAHAAHVCACGVVLVKGDQCWPLARRPTPWPTGPTSAANPHWFLPGPNQQVRHAGPATLLSTVCFTCPKAANDYST